MKTWFFSEQIKFSNINNSKIACLFGIKTTTWLNDLRMYLKFKKFNKKNDDMDIFKEKTEKLYTFFF